METTYRLRTFSEIRAEFWDTYPEFKKEMKKYKRQNDYSADIRTAFVDFVDFLKKSGDISTSIASRVTL